MSSLPEALPPRDDTKKFFSLMELFRPQPTRTEAKPKETKRSKPPILRLRSKTTSSESPPSAAVGSTMPSSTAGVGGTLTASAPPTRRRATSEEDILPPTIDVVNIDEL
mmetsp:Transcript_2094/g.5744  ORF Transcript_2094/g.5744 Transcript_2094/m.5744 type:complete len:109 (+) Transcript_2094:179-505(+)